MGAPIAYECRREELAAMSATTTVSADSTVNTLQPWKSFLGSTDPAQGLLTRYLELGQVAAVVGDVLFVHGAVHEHSMGCACCSCLLLFVFVACSSDRTFFATKMVSSLTSLIFPQYIIDGCLRLSLKPQLLPLQTLLTLSQEVTK